jgi:hypothetical protein
MTTFEQIYNIENYVEEGLRNGWGRGLIFV